MPKTNFTKVEAQLDEGLKRLAIEHLLEIASKAVFSGEKMPNLELRKAFVQTLDLDYKKLVKKDPFFASQAGYKRGDFKKFIQDPNTLTPEEWKLLKAVRSRIEAFKKELQKKLPQVSDEQLVAAERKKHINKRFNINEKWLPLK